MDEEVGLKSEISRQLPPRAAHRRRLRAVRLCASAREMAAVFPYLLWVLHAVWLHVHKYNGMQKRMQIREKIIRHGGEQKKRGTPSNIEALLKKKKVFIFFWKMRTPLGTLNSAQSAISCLISGGVSPSLLYPPLSLCVRVFNCAVIPECSLLGCLTLDITYMFIFHSVSPRFAQAHGFPWILFLKSLMRKPLVEWDSVIITTWISVSSAGSISTFTVLQFCYGAPLVLNLCLVLVVNLPLNVHTGA